MLTAAQRSDVRLDALRRQVSLAHIIERCAAGAFLGGAAVEYLQETARAAGRPYDAAAPLIDWGLLTTRADTVNLAAGGGFLVGQQGLLGAADALLPSVVAMQLGATVVEVRGANFGLPRQTGVPTAQCAGSEGFVAAESQPQFGLASLTPHTAIGYVETSRLLLLQSDADVVIKRDLLAIVGRAVDLASISGSGLLGQPLGITNTSGVGSFSGTALSLSALVDAFVSLGDGLGTNGGVAANRTTAGVLRKRPEVAGNAVRTLWEGKLEAGSCIQYPARSTTAIASGTLIVGSWEKLFLAFWNSGVELMVNPYGDVNSPTNFQKGIVGIRAVVSMDVGLSYPSAFSVATGVT